MTGIVLLALYIAIFVAAFLIVKFIVERATAHQWFAGGQRAADRCYRILRIELIFNEMWKVAVFGRQPAIHVQVHTPYFSVGRWPAIGTLPGSPVAHPPLRIAAATAATHLEPAHPGFRIRCLGVLQQPVKPRQTKLTIVR